MSTWEFSFTQPKLTCEPFTVAVNDDAEVVFTDDVTDNGDRAPCYDNNPNGRNVIQLEFSVERHRYSHSGGTIASGAVWVNSRSAAYPCAPYVPPSSEDEIVVARAFYGNGYLYPLKLKLT